MQNKPLPVGRGLCYVSRVCWAGGHLNAAQRKYLIAQCALPAHAPSRSPGHRYGHGCVTPLPSGCLSSPAEWNSPRECFCLIAQCELLVCCRTHASIAGYSTGVPTLVLGYSVKAEGIAADLGMGQGTWPQARRMRVKL